MERTDDFTQGVTSFLTTHSVPNMRTDVGTIVVMVTPDYAEVKMAQVIEELTEAAESPDALVELTPGPAEGQFTVKLYRNPR